MLLLPSCHQGINVGGNLYQKFGALESYYKVETDADKGRQAVTNDEADESVFKVPSLRNIEITAPYFHSGLVSASTIIEALFFELIDGNRTLSNQSITEAELGPVFE